MSSPDQEIFEEDYMRFAAVTPIGDDAVWGVIGGEDDPCRDGDGNVLHGGRPNRDEASSAGEGRRWRDAHCKQRDSSSVQELIGIMKVIMFCGTLEYSQ